MNRDRSYTRAISDVYQDIFREGSFIGKGIYDVDAFERALYGRFPENRILSHDLLEGSYARCGLLSDIQLYEAYPVRYERICSDVIAGFVETGKLHHGFYPGFRPVSQNHEKPDISVIEVEIFDNLRRSLVPIALMVMLLFGWIYLIPCFLDPGCAVGDHAHSLISSSGRSGRNPTRLNWFRTY